MVGRQLGAAAALATQPRDDLLGLLDSTVIAGAPGPARAGGWDRPPARRAPPGASASARSSCDGSRPELCASASASTRVPNQSRSSRRREPGRRGRPARGRPATTHSGPESRPRRAPPQSPARTRSPPPGRAPPTRPPWRRERARDRDGEPPPGSSRRRRSRSARRLPRASGLTSSRSVHVAPFSPPRSCARSAAPGPELSPAKAHAECTTPEPRRRFSAGQASRADDGATISDPCRRRTDREHPVHRNARSTTSTCPSRSAERLRSSASTTSPRSRPRCCR